LDEEIKRDVEFELEGRASMRAASQPWPSMASSY